MGCVLGRACIPYPDVDKGSNDVGVFGMVLGGFGSCRPCGSVGPRGGINETSQTRDLFYSATKQAQFFIPAAAWPMLFIRVLSG